MSFYDCKLQALHKRKYKKKILQQLQIYNNEFQMQYAM